ncbi:hypothetical protein LTR84_006686 [Exophiala bonariae]|uniref:Major facilitator superfamily (MFS) profile domain-containing protein n=1 Tax=Exophiala bonariae TaxID=1690606 RepID=A0AAV9N102_9EURO|nr:hypothetical protein LTR84_006686 [Exophiala bonariae]
MSRDIKDLIMHGEEVVSPKVQTPDITVTVDRKTERQTLQKMDVLLVPVTCMIYLLSFLDRANMGNARVAGLQTQLKLTDHQYQLVLTVTYIPYIVAEIPSNLVLKKVGPRLMIPGGFYRRHELQTRISFFFSAAALSGAFSGLLAAGIVRMDGLGGMEGWRWIFCIEGIITVVFGAASFFLLPNTPSQLLGFKEQHVKCCEARLLLDAGTGIPESTSFDLRKSVSAFTSLHIWLVTLSQFCGGTCLFGLAYFTPSIVASLVASFPSKPSLVEIQLLTVPPFVIAFAFAMAAAYVSDRYRRRGLTAICMISIAIIGWILFLTASLKNVGQRYTSLILVIVGIYSTAPSLISWIPNNVSTHMRRATAIAMSFMATNVGGIISSWIYPRSSAPQYHFAAKFNLALTCLNVSFMVAEVLLLRHLNSRKIEKREELLKDVAHLTPHEQYERLGDTHPDFKYTL